MQLWINARKTYGEFQFYVLLTHLDTFVYRTFQVYVINVSRTINKTNHKTIMVIHQRVYILGKMSGISSSEPGTTYKHNIPTAQSPTLYWWWSHTVTASRFLHRSVGGHPVSNIPQWPHQLLIPHPGVIACSVCNISHLTIINTG